MDENTGKVLVNGEWVWASEAPYAQDASLGQTVRERVEADRENTRAIRAGQQADPEGIVERVAAYTEPRFEHDSPHAPQQPSETLTSLPTDAAERKEIPICTGVLDYFSGALAEVAKVSKAGNDQHNPGQPLHWARGKSMDQADTIVRHLMERGTIDSDGMRHSAKVAWRALALLQTELEEAGLVPVSRGSR